MLVATGKPPGTNPRGGTAAQACLVPKTPYAFLFILPPSPYSCLEKLGQPFKLYHFFLKFIYSYFSMCVSVCLNVCMCATCMPHA